MLKGSQSIPLCWYQIYTVYMYVCIFLIYLLACSITLVISNTTCYLHLVFTIIVSLLVFVCFVFVLRCPPCYLVNCTAECLCTYKVWSKIIETRCLPWYGGHCSLRVRSTRPNCKPTVLPTSFETSETSCFSQEATETDGGGAWALHHDNAPAHKAHIPSRYFWQVMWFSNHPTPLTWLRVWVFNPYPANVENMVSCR
jgi:hypothetical protein